MNHPHSTARGERPGVATAPPEVQRLLTLTLVSAGVTLFLRIVGLFAGGAAGTTYRDRGLPADEAAREASVMAGQAAGTGATAAVVGLALTMAVYVLLYVLLAQGRNWARILGTVLAGISTVAAALGLLGALAHGGLGGVLLVLGILLAAVNVRWMVTAGRSPVRDWFAGRRTV